MLRVGLTGGIACGKSAAAAEFARLGAPIVDADEASREITAPGSPVLQELAALVPGEPLIVNGALDRMRLRRLIFANAALRRQAEAVLHPRILEKMRTDIAAARGDYVIVAIPLLAEAGAAGLVDRVLVLDCSEEIQIERLMSRDGETEEGAKQILEAQATREDRLALADDVINNDGTLGDLHTAIRALHRRYSKLGNSPPVSPSSLHEQKRE